MPGPSQAGQANSNSRGVAIEDALFLFYENKPAHRSSFGRVFRTCCSQRLTARAQGLAFADSRRRARPRRRDHGAQLVRALAARLLLTSRPTASRSGGCQGSLWWARRHGRGSKEHTGARLGVRQCNLWNARAVVQAVLCNMRARPHIRMRGACKRASPKIRGAVRASS